jgi:hypothetical protein
MQTCQLCYSKPATVDGKTKPATVDGKTKMGPWAYMCEDCHTVYGVGLGVGKGQRLKPDGGVKLLSDPITTAELKTVLEWVLDSPFEVDKWHTTVEDAYIRMGGTNRRFVHPGKREFMHG